jgi:hypothetical protein
MYYRRGVAVGVKAERNVHASGQMRAKIKQTTSCGVMISDDVPDNIGGQVEPRQAPNLP